MSYIDFIYLKDKLLDHIAFPIMVSPSNAGLESGMIQIAD